MSTGSPAAPAGARLEHDWTINRSVQWYRSPIPVARLRELSRRRTVRPLLHCIGFIAMLTATGTIVVLVHAHLSWPWLIPALLLHGSLYRPLQHSRHELCHRTVFPSRLLGEVFLRLFSFLCWSSPDQFRASHLRHHQFTVHDDLDQEVVLPRPLQPLRWVGRFVLAVPDMLMEIGALLQWSRGRLRDSPWERRCFADPPDGHGNRAKRATLFGWARVVLAGHLVLAVVFLATGNWILLLVVTFARWLAPWLSYLLVETQHAGLCSDVPDHRRCCRTILLGPVTRFLYWHMNFHIEHHMFPSVPFYNLHKLRAAIADDLPAAPRGLVRAWAQMLPILWRQRRDPDYRFIPTVRAPAGAAVD